MISVKNISKKFGRGTNLLSALDDVSFNVEDGEFVVKIGRASCRERVFITV